MKISQLALIKFLHIIDPPKIRCAERHQPELPILAHGGECLLMFTTQAASVHASWISITQPKLNEP
jgi:hypothetical protein